MDQTVAGVLQPNFAKKARKPHRLSLRAPAATQTYLLPVKESVIDDPRLSRGTLRFLLKLWRWSQGKSSTVRTTLGIVARQLGVSTRQVRRYHHDAAELGYILQIGHRFGRDGMIVGMFYSLNLALFKPDLAYWRRRPQEQTGRNPVRTEPAAIDTIFSKSNPLERGLGAALSRLELAMGIPPPEPATFAA